MKIINAIAAVLTFVILLASATIPLVIGKRGAANGPLWQVAAVLLLAAATVGMFKAPRFSLLFLFVACAFFFVSCTANFHWG